MKIKQFALPALISVLFSGCLTEQEIIKADLEITDETTIEEILQSPQYNRDLSEEEVREKFQNAFASLTALPTNFTDIAPRLDGFQESNSLGKTASISSFSDFCDDILNKLLIIASNYTNKPKSQFHRRSSFISLTQGSLDNLCATDISEEEFLITVKDYLENESDFRFFVNFEAKGNTNTLGKLRGITFRFMQDRDNEIDEYFFKLELTDKKGNLKAHIDIGFQGNDEIHSSSINNQGQGTITLILDNGTFICDATISKNPFINLNFSASCTQNEQFVGSINVDENGFHAKDVDGKEIEGLWNK